MFIDTVQLIAHPMFAVASVLTDGIDNSIDPTAHTNLSTVQVASIFIGIFLPIIVALITKQVWAPQTKAIILAALSALSGFLTEYVNSADFVWQQALLTTVVTFVTAVATYFGLWSRPAENGDSMSAKAGRTLVK